MKTSKRKRYSAEFKAKAAPATIRGKKMLNELAEQFEEHNTE